MKGSVSATIVLLLLAPFAVADASAAELNPGDILAADLFARAIVVLDPAGGTKAVWSGSFATSSPADVAVSRDGRVFVTNNISGPAGGIAELDPATGLGEIVLGPTTEFRRPLRIVADDYGTFIALGVGDVEGTLATSS